MAKGPVLIEFEAEEKPKQVADAPPVPDRLPDGPQGAAMQMTARVAVRQTSPLLKWFFGLGAALLAAVMSIAAWDFVTGMVARFPLLGFGIGALFAAFLFVLALICIRELAALGRLSRVDALRQAADTALAENDLSQARIVSDRLVALYKSREDTRWARERFADLRGDQLDAAGLLDLTQAELLRPLDQRATREVEAAARQVAAVTALVPLALADVAAALTANIRMIRRIAEIYGGRSGTLGSLRLTRAVFSHLLATGAVAVGDDLLEPVLGGSILGKLSRRFGEGLVNGALTARVGVAAMEVCRPLAFVPEKRPKVRDIIKSSLGGMFSSPKS